jgi:hypothetical protein
MSVYYDRGADNPDFNVLTASGRIIIPMFEAQEQFGVESFIRITQSEYPVDAVEGSKLVHFNLPSKGEKVGGNTALARILENGHYIPGDSEVPPLLSLENIWIGRITRIIETIKYDEIAPEFFGHTIGGIRNVQELKERILTRYRPSMPALSDDQILRQGVSIREIELVEKVSGVKFLVQKQANWYEK